MTFFWLYFIRQPDLNHRLWISLLCFFLPKGLWRWRVRGKPGPFEPDPADVLAFLPTCIRTSIDAPLVPYVLCRFVLINYCLRWLCPTLLPALYSCFVLFGSDEEDTHCPLSLCSLLFVHCPIAHCPLPHCPLPPCSLSSSSSSSPLCNAIVLFVLASNMFHTHLIALTHCPTGRHGSERIPKVS